MPFLPFFHFHFLSSPLFRDSTSPIISRFRFFIFFRFLFQLLRFIISFDISVSPSFVILRRIFIFFFITSPDERAAVRAHAAAAWRQKGGCSKGTPRRGSARRGGAMRAAPQRCRLIAACGSNVTRGGQRVRAQVMFARCVFARPIIVFDWRPRYGPRSARGAVTPACAANVFHFAASQFHHFSSSFLHTMIYFPIWLLFFLHFH